MYKKIKQHFRRYPLLVKTWQPVRHFFKHELKDIRDSYFSKTSKLRITPYGFKLIGSNSIHHHEMQEGTFEPEEVALFKEQFLQADLFVDVGSNIGFYACMARSVGRHVVAVEPLPKNLEYLFANLLANDWKDVEVFPVGLSENPGLATLYGASSTGASLIGNWAGASKFFQRTIPISTLDILLGDRFAGKKIFIKIDVEGVEYPVLLGAGRVIQMHPKPTWVLEVCLNEYHPDGVNPHFRDVFDLFWRNGYEVRTADKNNKLIQPADVERWLSNGCCDSGTINYKFAPLG